MYLSYQSWRPASVA